MVKDLFGSYNIRARLSVYVIIITPIIVSVYIYYPPIRNLGASTILLIALAAFSNYFLVLLRHLVNNHYYADTAATFLYPEDTHLSAETKQRYYCKLSDINDSFAALKSASDSDEFKACCSSAVNWLKNNNRDNKLVNEEGILYGFINNLLNMKRVGFFLLSISVLIQVFFIYNNIESLGSLFHNSQHVLSLWMDLALALFWLFGVNKRICKDAAEKYAYTLLSTIDIL